ncbi:MAG TPA: hypothetical protein VF035_01645 [Longimicrobiales bacterium]|jgi:hypothetical protein
MFSLAMTLQESTSFFGQIVHSIPRDASAVLVYVLMAAFCGLIWVGSRQARP